VVELDVGAGMGGLPRRSRGVSDRSVLVGMRLLQATGCRIVKGSRRAVAQMYW
jgi:hypothetical protein